MESNKKYISSVLSLGILFSVTFTLIYAPFSARATSAYDTYINKINTLQLRRQNYYTTQNCTAVDMSSNWSEIIRNIQVNFNATYHDYYSMGGTASSLATSFNAAVDNGSWAVYRYPEYTTSAGVYNDTVYVAWKESGQMSVDWTTSSGSAVLTGYDHIVGIQFDTSCTYAGKPNIAYFQLGNTGIGLSNNTTANGGDGWFQVYLFTNVSNTIPDPSYAGTLIPDGSTFDIDGDGLTGAQEKEQGTLDSTKDTDGDGIDDFKESQWFPNRSSVFCNTSVTPNVCAYPDPLAKDIYLEIDWMQDANHNYQPYGTQLSLLETGLQNAGFTNVHIDTGDYGGGAPMDVYSDLHFQPTSSGVDFFDLKDGDAANSISAHFNPNRKGIWHYMISGNEYSDEEGSSGISYAGSDDTFISYGLIQANPGGVFGNIGLDTAIAGTMLHELGHDLCLSNVQKYTFQSSSCIFSGVDSYASASYDSVMNYNVQMFLPEPHYSSGTNGTGDHNDMSAIDEGGMADFSRWTMSDISSGTSQLRRGISTKEAKEAAKNGTLGKLKKGDKLYDYGNNKIYDLKTGKVQSLDAKSSTH